MAKSQNNNFTPIYKFMSIFTFIAVVVTGLSVMYTNMSPKSSQGTDTSTNITSATYTCDGGATIQAQFFDDKAEVMLPNDTTLLLMQGISASGVRYTNSDESITFWTKGNTAFIEEGNTTTYNNCTETTN